MKLVFGENEVVYPKKGRPRKPGRGASRATKTTADVAAILEAKYSLLETFFDVYYEEIVEGLMKGLEEDLEFVFSGERPPKSFKKAEAAVAELFREFIESGTAERVGIPGTPTWAALIADRPSFWDTGLFKNNARFWVEAE